MELLESTLGDLIKWAFTGLISTLFIIIWFVTKQWIKSIRDGFKKIYEKLEELVFFVGKVDKLTHRMDERINQIDKVLSRHETELKELDDKVNHLRNSTYKVLMKK